MSDNFLAVAFALASALTIAWGTVVRHNVVLDTEAPLKAAMRAPIWWAGFSTALLGYALQILALYFGPLLIVQPVLVLSLMFTLLLSARLNRRALDPAESMWSLVLSAAVAVVLIVGRPEETSEEASNLRWLVAGGVGVLIMILLGLVGRNALILGLVTGGIFGYVAVLSKASVDIFSAHGLWELATSWQPWLLGLAALIGTMVQQYSFSAGPLRQSLPAMTIGEPIVAFTLGVIILGERMQIHSFGAWLLLSTALITAVVATWQLARNTVPGSRLETPSADPTPQQVRGQD